MASELTPRINTIETDVARALASSRNMIINGNFRYWQRGITLALDGNNTYLADRFAAFANITGIVGTQSRETVDLPTYAQSGVFFPSAYKMLATTGATADANNAAIMFQRIEGYKYADMHGGKPIYFQFWVKAAKTGTMSVQFSNGVNDRRYVTTVTINAANTWELKGINLNSDTTGNWTLTSGIGLNVAIMLDAAGTRLTSTLNQWFVPAVTQFMASTTQTHFLSSNNDYVLITGVQLLPGNFTEMVTPTIMDPGEELVLCQRYFEKSYNHIGAFPGESTSSGAHEIYGRVTAASTIECGTTRFATAKRTNPTITLYPTDGSPSGSMIDHVGNEVVSTVEKAGEGSFTVFTNAGAGYTIGQAGSLIGHWTAEAEL